MKKIIIPCLAAVLFVSLHACTTVEQREPASHSTTTTTETRSVQSN